MNSLFRFSIFIFIFGFLSTLSSDGRVKNLVVFYKTYASLSIARDEILFPIHGHMYSFPGSRTKARVLLWGFKKIFDLTDDEIEDPRFKERSAYFLADKIEEKKLKIYVNNSLINLRTHEETGYFYGLVKVKGSNLRNQRLFLNYEDADGNTYRTAIDVLDLGGISIISDIDDTIQESSVHAKRELIRNKLIREYKPVQRMAELYRRFEDRGASFFYVSDSPWQFYKAIKDFIDAHSFPQGVLHLRQFDLSPSNIYQMLKAERSGKYERISNIIDRFPYRKFILVGDSGEKDPEIYASIAKKYPGRIQKICIRNVSSEDLNNERFRILYPLYPKMKWILFIDPRELF